MERSSPYPPDPDRLDPDSLHRNGNYGLNISYSTVDTNHKNNFTESRPRSYGNEHYTAANSYQVSQNYHYGYPAGFTPEAHRSPYESVPYTGTENMTSSLDRALDLYRPRSADPSHSFSHYDYPGHHSAHFRPASYHEDASYRPTRDQYFNSETKHGLPEPKTNYPLYEEARMTFQERPYSANAGTVPEYISSKASDISSELLTSADLRSSHSVPLAPRDVDTSILGSESKKIPENMFEMSSDHPRESLPPGAELDASNRPLIDTDPLDLRKTENWTDSGAYATDNAECTSISAEIDKEAVAKALKKSELDDTDYISDKPKAGNSEIEADVVKNHSNVDSVQHSGAKAGKTFMEDAAMTNNSVAMPIKDELPAEKVLKSDEIAEPEIEIMGKKKKAVVEAEMKINQEKEAKKLSEAANASPEEKFKSRRKSKTPVKDSENELNKSKTDEDDDEKDDDDEVFHCGFCGEIFHNEDLLVQHDCQNEDMDSEDSEDSEEEEDEDEEVEEETSASMTSSASTPKKTGTGNKESNTPIRRSARKNKAQIHIKEGDEDEEEEDPFICGECGQTFDKERLLLRHVKTHRTSDIEDYVEAETPTPSRYATRSRINRPKRKATKRKSYDYETEESYIEPPSRSKRKKEPIIKIKEPKVPVVEDTRKYGCAICGEISTGRDCIAQHLIDHCSEIASDEKVWSCEYCEKMFSDENFLDRHVEIHELNGDQKLVKIEPLTKKDLKKESTIGKVKQYECVTCNQVFKLKNELKAHERIHNETRKYLCVVCGEESTGKEAYLKHKKAHKTPKSYSCEECGDTFNLRSLLNQHMKSHGLKTSFDCEQCNRSFFSAGHLAIHKKGHKHAGTKKHRCQECGYQVYSEAKLMEHLESHINQDPFMCPFCGRLFMKKSTFTKHKKKHSGQNMCDVCGKAFSHKSGLDRHYTTHSGEKSFKCMYCDKSFSQQSNLSTHMRQHSGEKPFMCEICAHSFTNKCSLVRHMTKHTEGESEMQAASMARQGAVGGLNNINIPLPPLPNSISHGMYTLNQFQF